MVGEWINLQEGAAPDGTGVLDGYIHAVEERYDVHINVHDVAGLCSLDPDLEKALATRAYHNNPFCNFIKKNSGCMRRCIDNKEALCAFGGKTRRPFRASCYMGVTEFIYPVMGEDRVIAMLCVGQFCDDAEQTRAAVLENGRRYGFDGEVAVRLFSGRVHSAEFPVGALSADVGLLCNYLALLYHHRVYNPDIKALKGLSRDLAPRAHQDNHIVDATVHFIQRNYDKDLTLKLLASNAFCNPTYLSHIFKAKMKVGISDYINRTRVIVARELLDVTPRSVTDIAVLVGFNDPGYFSRIFRRLMGMGPSAYRRRDHKDPRPLT